MRHVVCEGYLKMGLGNGKLVSRCRGCILDN